MRKPYEKWMFNWEFGVICGVTNFRSITTSLKILTDAGRFAIAHIFDGSIENEDNVSSVVIVQSQEDK